MKILEQNFNIRSLMNAAAPGLALSVLFLVILMVAVVMSEMPSERRAGDSTTSTSAFVSSATAAVPASGMLTGATPVVTGADPRLDEFRLDPDSCCISHS